MKETVITFLGVAIGCFIGNVIGISIAFHVPMSTVVGWLFGG